LIDGLSNARNPASRGVSPVAFERAQDAVTQLETLRMRNGACRLDSRRVRAFLSAQIACGRKNVPALDDTRPVEAFAVNISDLSDQTLRRELPVVVGRERGATAVVLAYIAEYDARKLYPEDGYESMYAFPGRRAPSV
jgi:hypothetical protein